MVLRTLLHAICCAVVAAVKQLLLLVVRPARRVRLHGVQARPELDGFHATTVVTAVDNRITVRLDRRGEIIHVHEATEATLLSPGLLADATFSSGAIAVTEIAGRALGMVATRPIARGALIFEEAPLVVITIGEHDDDPRVAALNDDARTVLAINQMRLGRPPAADEWGRLPGMQPIMERIVALQAARSFHTLSDQVQARWWALCDSSSDSLGCVDGSKLPAAAHAGRPEASMKTVDGILYSNSFGGTADGTRASVLFETLSRANHSCAPNIDMQTDAARGHRARVTALRDIDAGEELLLSYLGSVGSARMERPVEERRAELRRKYRFHCECARCGAIALAQRRRYERLEAQCAREDAEVSAEVARYNETCKQG